MSLNTIQLTSSVVIDLYKKTLVDIPDPDRTILKSQGDSDSDLIEYLGGNRKNIIIIVTCPQHHFVPQPELDFLNSILKACRLDISDVAVINAAHFRLNIEVLKKQFLPEVLLIFGKDAGLLNGNIPDQFALAEIEGMVTVSVPELCFLNQDTAEGKDGKKKLWTLLKRLFQVT